MGTVVGASCVFCAIVSGESPAHVVYEDDVVIAFLDRHPATTGHTLVVPRRHAADIWSLDVDDAAAPCALASRYHDGYAPRSVCPD